MARLVLMLLFLLSAPIAMAAPPHCDMPEHSEAWKRFCGDQEQPGDPEDGGEDQEGPGDGAEEPGDPEDGGDTGEDSGDTEGGDDEGDDTESGDDSGGCSGCSVKDLVRRRARRRTSKP